MYKINNEISVREAKLSDLDTWYKWFNDKTINKYLIHGRIPNTRKNQEEFYNTHYQGKNGKILYIICNNKKSEIPLGVCSFNYNLNCNYARRYEISLIIGDKKYHNSKNYLDITLWQIEHVFLELNGNSIFANTNEDNQVVKFTLKRLGFREVGLFKEVDFKNGKYQNSIYFELLKKNWQLHK